MNKETTVLLIVGVLLAVTILQGFQLSGLAGQLQARASAAPAVAYAAPAPAPVAAAAAPAAPVPAPAQPAMVGGC